MSCVSVTYSEYLILNLLILSFHEKYTLRNCSLRISSSFPFLFSVATNKVIPPLLESTNTAGQNSSDTRDCSSELKASCYTAHSFIQQNNVFLLPTLRCSLPLFFSYLFVGSIFFLFFTSVSPPSCYSSLPPFLLRDKNRKFTLVRLQDL